MPRGVRGWLGGDGGRYDDLERGAARTLLPCSCLPGGDRDHSALAQRHVAVFGVI